MRIVLCCRDGVRDEERDRSYVRWICCMRSPCRSLYRIWAPAIAGTAGKAKQKTIGAKNLGSFSGLVVGKLFG